MRANARIQAVIELLDTHLSSATPVDKQLNHYFRSRKYMGSKDRSVIAEHFYDLVRHRLLHQELLRTQNVVFDARSWMALSLHLADESLSKVFNSEKYAPIKLDAPIRESILAIKKSDVQAQPEHVRLNVPDWMYQRLKDFYQAQVVHELSALNQPAPLDLRVNSLLANRDHLLSVLHAHGLHAVSQPLSPWAIRSASRKSLQSLAQFKRGEIEIQDVGSQVLALLTGVCAGQTVVDFCAGGGGKTLALGAMMQGKGSLYALDISQPRLKQCAIRTARAGLHNVRVVKLASERDNWLNRHKRFADCVFVDAPCSGVGAWRRNPDSRWHLDDQAFLRLTQLQGSILQHASTVVKPQGYLFYASCSLFAEENEQQIQSFLNSDRGKVFNLCNFDQVPNYKQRVPELLQERTMGLSELRLSPFSSNTDGFYLACLKRDAVGSN